MKENNMKETIPYSEFVNNLCKDGRLIAKEMTPENAHLLHMAVGIAGEAGELLDAIKKAVIYNKPLDILNIIEELGDLEFYMQGLRNSLLLSRASTIDHNMAKLGKRYFDGYSDKSAQDRADKQK